MSFLSGVFASKPNATPIAARRELLTKVLRDTLNRHGIPPAWIGADMLLATSREAGQGIHWRLLIKHWDPRVLAHSVALQNSLSKRLATFDPRSSTWLMGISWQFDLPNDSVCPEMPPPTFWTTAPPVIHAPAPAAAAGQAKSDSKADLEHIFAQRDAQLQREHAAFPKTEPSPLS